MAKPDNTLKRKEREEKREAENGLKFVIDGAKLKCDLCTVPEGDLKVNFDTPSIQDKRVATVVEKDKTSLIFKGNCKKSPNSSSPCASVMKLADWKDVGTVYFQDQFPLLLKSTIKCEYGGTDIKITDCAQRNVIEKIDTVAAPVPNAKEIESYKCIHCEEEITSEFLRKTIGVKKLSSKQVEIIDLFLPYINKYRKDFGLDTCLRKAHFVSQIGVESANFTTFSEFENYSNPPGIFSSKTIQIDNTIVNSLKENLTSIFKIVDAKGEVIIKTNEELKTLLLKDKPSIVDKELYAAYKGVKDSKDKKKFNDKLIKEILKSDKTIDYKIYLKAHTYFGVPLMSRAYAPYVGDKRGLGNGDELTRDGWKFKGRGLKQLTGRSNYVNFTNYRNKNTFTGDTSGQIDFTAEKDGVQLKGNYLKISDDAMYATQSALYFWNDGTKKNKKFAKEHADNDDIELVIKCVNEYDGKVGKNNRRANLNRARQEGIFDINRHYKLMLENGDDKQKEEAKKYLKKKKDSGDEVAAKILEEEEKKNPTKKNEK